MELQLTLGPKKYLFTTQCNKQQQASKQTIKQTTTKVVKTFYSPFDNI
jgi:hypothetical protein